MTPQSQALELLRECRDYMTTWGYRDIANRIDAFILSAQKDDRPQLGPNGEKVMQPFLPRKKDWIEEELADGDRICAAAGVQRTEGGRLPVAKIVNALRAATSAQKDDAAPKCPHGYRIENCGLCNTAPSAAPAAPGTTQRTDAVDAAYFQDRDYHGYVSAMKALARQLELELADMEMRVMRKAEHAAEWQAKAQSSPGWIPVSERLPLDEAIQATIVDIAELPDRDSPDDWPEAMLVTAAELDRILRENFGQPLPAAPVQPATPSGKKEGGEG